jgi:hypothetical protein
MAAGYFSKISPKKWPDFPFLLRTAAAEAFPWGRTRVMPHPVKNQKKTTGYESNNV